MPSSVSARIDVINAELAALLPRTHAAISGGISFNVEQVRALSRPISEMALILAATKSTPRDPQFDAQLRTYKSLLRELQPLLDQLHRMLLSRRDQIASGQSQLQAVSHWANALSNTSDF